MYVLAPALCLLQSNFQSSFGTATGFMEDPHDLQRFVDAQEPVYDRVLEELGRGQKSSHWMWFVFPQIEGLGRSSTARKYAISSAEEARAYLQHPLLGARLRECTRLVLQVEGRTGRQIFGSVDDLKFRSSMTLFALAGADSRVFEEAIEKYYSGEYDPMTIERL